MMIEYKCCFCKNSYSWYEGLYENPNYNIMDELKARRNGQEYKEKAGTYIQANGIKLCVIQPLNDTIDAKTQMNVAEKQ